eukprot:TRINITY_DN73890_c0_g1_i1.p1 TRINITY_DN73890_c0_g1~~TRINITY_DN73890_c0_g1_i1.p1  ORF type:complete len:569 (+),score=72.73 TRINITY_DN73890_c0_g1_i1:118-1707(+)
MLPSLWTHHQRRSFPHFLNPMMFTSSGCILTACALSSSGRRCIEVARFHTTVAAGWPWKNVLFAPQRVLQRHRRSAHQHDSRQHQRHKQQQHSMWGLPRLRAQNDTRLVFPNRGTSSCAAAAEGVAAADSKDTCDGRPVPVTHNNVMDVADCSASDVTHHPSMETSGSETSIFSDTEVLSNDCGHGASPRVTETRSQARESTDEAEDLFQDAQAKAQNLDAVLAQLRAPPKELVHRAAYALAKRRIPSVIGDSFIWEPRGSMFSMHYQHVSDIDLHYFSKKPIKRQTIQDLERHRKRLGIVSFTLIRKCNGIAEDEELKWGTYRSNPSGFWGACDDGLRAVVLTGVVQVAGEWLVPIDIVLSSESDHNEPVHSRLQKMSRNVDRGKSWKALQRLRGLLGNVRSQRGRTKLRNEIAEDINKQIGQLRFLLIQLELFQRSTALKKVHRAGRNVKVSTYIENHEYFTKQLGLPGNISVDDLHSVCKLELKHRSDAIWMKYKDKVASNLWHGKYSDYAKFNEMIPAAELAEGV